MYIIGQICGVIGAIISIFKPQFRKKEHILLCILLVNVMCTLNFTLIGKTGSASLVCMVAILQSAIALHHERHGKRAPDYERIIFFVLYLGVGLAGVVLADGFVWELSWKNALELLPVLGALMLMFSVFAKGEQRTRVFLLFNGGVWVLYNAIVGATTIFTNIVTLCSTSYALWKYRKK